MQVYRLYFLNANGRVMERQEVECASDADAEAVARALDQTTAIEIWQGARKVTVVAQREIIDSGEI